MTSQQILQADFLDILFEKRNKAYGAYMLRKKHDGQLVKATIITVSFAILLLYFLRTGTAASSATFTPGDVIVREYTVPAQKPKPATVKKLVVAKTPAMKQQQFVSQIVMVEKPVTTMAAQNDLTNAAISGTTLTTGVDAPPFTEPPTPPQPSGTGEGSSGDDVVYVDRQPQFPGGMQAWGNFLNKHLRMPQQMDAGEKRTVTIRFYVAEDGTVADFEVVASAGEVFDNEVIRVLKKMPRWLPALQHNKPIAVSFLQPVIFVAPEE